MKNPFRSLMVGLVAAVVIVTAAYARTIFQERSDGYAVYTRTPSGNQYLVGRQVLTAQFADIATASTIHVSPQVDGTITAWYSIINNAITNADCILTLVYNDNWTDRSTITVTQSGSAIGDVDSATGLTLTATAGAKVRLVSDGGCDTTTIASIRVFVDPR